MTRFFLVIATLCGLLLPPAPAAAQNGLPDPVSPHVNDFANLLSDAEEAELATQLRKARDARGVEMTVVIIERISRYSSTPSIEAFATELFNHWGVGNAERNDGIMLLVALGDRKTRIELGRGYAARFDTTAQGIIDNHMLPSFRKGDYKAGITRGTTASLRLLDINWQPPQDTRSWFTRNMEDSVPFQMLVILGGMVTLPLSPIFVILGVSKYRKHRRRRCPECRRKMTRLGEVQENQYLDAGQRLEERLQSSDFGVWICEHDEHVTVQRFSLASKKHGACPDCNYHTMETRREVTTAPTYSTTGVVTLYDNCAHCKREETRTVPIPMRRIKPDNDHHYSSSSSSSYSSSGSFGGGSSSGGGASGSW